MVPWSGSVAGAGLTTTVATGTSATVPAAVPAFPSLVAVSVAGGRHVDVVGMGREVYVEANVVACAGGVGDGGRGGIVAPIASVDGAGGVEAHDDGQVGPIGGGAVGEAHHAVHVRRGGGGVELGFKGAGLRRDGVVAPGSRAAPAAGGRGGRRAGDRDFRNAVPRAGAVAMAHDADVAAGRRRERVALELQGLPAALTGEDLGPGDGVQRHLDVKGRSAGVAQVPGDVHVIDGRERAEVVLDPLAIARRRPARGQVVVERILWKVAIIPARDDRGRGKRGEIGSDDGWSGRAVRRFGLGEIALT